MSSIPPVSSRVGPTPSRWPAPTPPEERVRATAIAFLQEVGRLVEDEASPDAIAAVVRAAIERVKLA